MFEQAVARPAAERPRFVAEATGGDRALEAAVLRMLEADAAEHALLDGSALPTAQDPFLGRVIGSYRLDERIGEGGMATVYRASRVDGAFSRPVAVKLLHLGGVTEAMRRRFLREPRFLGRLEHPHIARLLDGGTTAEGIPYLVMEHIQGERIDRWCDQLGLDVDLRLRLFVKVCRAVDHAHRALVVHRDLKPTNVLVTDDGEPRLVDFGVAGLLAEATAHGGAEPDDVDGAAAYTPEYASPEQVAGRPVGVAGDVFSLGVLLFELLTGTRPYDAAQVRRMAEDEKHRPEPPLASAAFLRNAAGAAARAQARSSTPRRLARRLAGDLDAIAQTALAADPAGRYPGCLELAADVERHLAHFPVHVRDAGLDYRLGRFLRRNLVAATLSFALLASLATGAAVSWRMMLRAQAEAEHTRIEAKSSKLIADALSEVFLDAVLFDDALARTRAQDRIHAQAAALRVLHADNDHLRANLLDALGRAALRVQLFDDAEALILEALHLREATFGMDHLERALSLSSLGTLEYERGRMEEARAALAEALRIQLANPGAVHADVATAKNDLAAALSACGEVEAALALHREALAERRSRDPASLDVAESLNNLSAQLARLRRFDEARDALDDAIELRTALLGPAAPLTLQSLANRGALELSRREFEAARKDLLHAARGLRELRTAGARSLCHALPMLATAHAELGDLGAAAAALDEAAALAPVALGRDHPRTADLHEARARVAERDGDPAAGVLHWEQALRIREARLPRGHRNVAGTRLHLGFALRDAGESARAKEAAEQALAELQDDALHAANCRHLLGLLAFEAGDDAEAEMQLRYALDLLPAGEADARARAQRDLEKVQERASEGR